MQHLEGLLTTLVFRMAALAASASDPERHSWFYRQRFRQYFQTQDPRDKREISARFGAVAFEADETPAGKVQIHCRYDPERQCVPSRHGRILNYPLSYHVRPDIMVLCPTFWYLPRIRWTLSSYAPPSDQVEVLLSELLQFNTVYRPATRFVQIYRSSVNVPERQLRFHERLYDTRTHLRFAKAIYIETPPPYRDGASPPPPLTPRPRPPPPPPPRQHRPPSPSPADDTALESGGGEGGGESEEEEAVTSPGRHMVVAHYTDAAMAATHNAESDAESELESESSSDTDHNHDRIVLNIVGAE